MRILHTSDWHLGRTFHRESMIGAQADYVDHLVETVRDERVDVVCVAGDVFDRALPPVDAVRLYGEALGRLVAEKAHVVLISGNHDSSVRLGAAAELMDAAGVHIRTDPLAVDRPVMIDGVAFYGIPYLEPDLVRTPYDLSERSHTAALTHAMDRVRAHRAQRKVVLAHAFVIGGDACDSERDISVGGVAQVPLNTFAGADYVALGHLHGRQTLDDQRRYSGSPLAYSFSEARHVKGSWLVELGESATFVPAPVPRPMGRLRGEIDELLSGDQYAKFEDHWLQITLTDVTRPKAAMERLRKRFPHALTLAFEPPEQGPDRTWAERIKDRSELEISFDFVRHTRGEGPDDAETALLQKAFEAARRDTDRGVSGAAASA